MDVIELYPPRSHGTHSAHVGIWWTLIAKYKIMFRIGIDIYHCEMNSHSHTSRFQHDRDRYTGTSTFRIAKNCNS